MQNIMGRGGTKEKFRLKVRYRLGNEAEWKMKMILIEEKIIIAKQRSSNV